MITLSAEQERAKDKAGAWIKQCAGQKKPEKQVFTVTGFAGSGKTSIAIDLIEDVEGQVICAAPTAKAAYVMRQKGLPDPKTLHKVIYLAGSGDGSGVDIEDKQQELQLERLELAATGMSEDDIELQPRVKVLKRVIKEASDKANAPIFRLNPDSALRHASLLVLDEGSMVDEVIGKDALSFGVPILVLGDPGQLPPVKGKRFFFRKQSDVHLEEIHRQAKDSPVIRLATMARLGERIPYGDMGDSTVVEKMAAEAVANCDIMILGKNEHRHIYNARIRQLRGYTDDFPQPGERVVCLRNNYDRGVLNGGIWIVRGSGRRGGGRISMDLISEEGDQKACVEAHGELFRGNKQNALSPAQAHDRDTCWFDFGYAVTVWKAQGSQWPRITVYDQSSEMPGDPRLWRYTAITRAQQSLVLRQ